MLRTRNQIVYIPYPTRRSVNEYTTNMVKILQKQYKVNGELAKGLDIARMWDTKAVILNWVEKKLDGKMKFQLFLYQIFGAKIVWFFHNKLPHDVVQAGKIEKKIKWISNRCDVIVLHSQSSRNYIPNRKRNQKKVVYIPHILYHEQAEKNNLADIRKKYGISESDFVFTIFGMIRPYKNIEWGMECFTKLGLPNSKLVIAGIPTDPQYAKKIKTLGAGNKNIIFDIRFLSNVLLGGIIGISDVIVLPYHDESSMNSGVMIQAFSNGKTVIAPPICMAQDFAKEGFFYGYRHSLEKAMKKAYENGKDGNREMGVRAQQYMKQNHNEMIVSDQLLAILDKE